MATVGGQKVGGCGPSVGVGRTLNLLSRQPIAARRTNNKELSAIKTSSDLAFTDHSPWVKGMLPENIDVVIPVGIKPGIVPLRHKAPTPRK